jgi:CDP-glucose 4,6-dehydratase
MKKNFWKNKNVLITGISGFVGSNLAKELNNNGAMVTGITQSKNKNSMLFFEKIDKEINLIYGSILDKNLLDKVLTKYNIEICFHLAAQVEVGFAKKNPYYTWQTNIKGTYNLLEAIRLNGKKVRSLIVASSDKAYGEYGLKFMPYNENYKLKPIYPYDVSKACADMISLSYSSDLFKMPIIVTRFCNIYGPGQLNFTALFPDLIRSVLNKKIFKLRSDGKSIRDFIYIKDIVDIYKLLATKLFLNPIKYRGEVFNAGTNKPHKIKDIVSIVYEYKNEKKLLERTLKNIKKNKTKGEISVQYMNYKKLNKYFKWKPKYSVKSSLSETIKWYQKYFKEI